MKNSQETSEKTAFQNPACPDDGGNHAICDDPPLSRRPSPPKRLHILQFDQD